MMGERGRRRPGHEMAGSPREKVGERNGALASEKEGGVFARLRLGRSSGACEGEGGVFAGLCLVQKWRSLRELPPPRERRRSLLETPPAEAGRSLRAVESQLTSQKNGARDGDSAGSNNEDGTQQNWVGG